MVGWLGRRRGGNTVASPVGMKEAEIIHSRGITVSRAVAISKALMMIDAAVRFMGVKDIRSHFAARCTFNCTRVAAAMKRKSTNATAAA